MSGLRRLQAGSAASNRRREAGNGQGNERLRRGPGNSVSALRLASGLRRKNARLAASRPGVSLFPLRRLFQVSGERENLSPLLRGDPLYLRLEARRNVELNHLRHIHPPIHGSSPIVLGITMPVSCSVTYLDAGGARKSQAEHEKWHATFSGQRCFIGRESRRNRCPHLSSRAQLDLSYWE